MIVMKFGGTSVGNAERIKNAAAIVKSNLGRKPIIVVSAVAKMTDTLIRLAKAAPDGQGDEIFEEIKRTHYTILEGLELEKSILDGDFAELSGLLRNTQQSKQLNDAVLDAFQSFGEKISSKIFAAHLNKAGIMSQAFNSWELGLLTSGDFGNAEPLKASYAAIKKKVSGLNILPVITGFIGRAEKGETTTLGRGGSDYTAAIFGAAAGAEEIQIWTDVDGIMSADPKVVPGAKTIKNLSFDEASELAYFGARVIHPKTLLPAIDKNISVRVLNTFNPQHQGTTITKKSLHDDRIIKAIVCKKNITLINIKSSRMLGAYGFLARIFSIFAKYGKSVDAIATSEVAVSLTIDDNEGVDKIVDELNEISSTTLATNKAIICVVGGRMEYEPGIAGRIFSTLGKEAINIEMISQGASQINMTFIVDGKDAEKSVNTLHNEFFGE